MNVGGGLGVSYLAETPPDIETYVTAICERIKNRTLKLHVEPGRALVAESGILLTRVEYIKPSLLLSPIPSPTPSPQPSPASGRGGLKSFAIVDAGMNDLLRPSLYEAWHDIVSVTPHNDGEKALYDIVGPVCETGDFLGKNRELILKEGDLLAVLNAGAYGFSMSSHYNSRPRVAEVMVDKDKTYLIRAREQEHDLFAAENIIP